MTEFSIIRLVRLALRYSIFAIIGILYLTFVLPINIFVTFTFFVNWIMVDEQDIIECVEALFYPISVCRIENHKIQLKNTSRWYKSNFHLNIFLQAVGSLVLWFVVFLVMIL